jgi:hypothetical protein
MFGPLMVNYFLCHNSILETLIYFRKKFIFDHPAVFRGGFADVDVMSPC